MKKIILSTVGLFTLSLFMVSCSSESDVLSSFSKRKYLKNFKESKTTLDKSNDNYTAKKTVQPIEINKADFVIAKVVEENNPIITKNSATISYEEIVKIQSSTPKKVAKQIEKEYRNWDKFNRNYSTEFLASSKEYNYNSLNNSSARVNEIVLAILAIFIPPLAVFLFENSLSTNFWVDLLLTLLFWLPGIIFAFLVIFAGVSL